MAEADNAPTERGYECPSVLVIIGNVSSGKSTLAERYARATGAERISSDETRAALKAAREPWDGKAVFATMQRRMVNLLRYGVPVVIDTTGMSHRFPGLLHIARLSYSTTVVRLTCSKDTWKKREHGRTDREALEPAVYIRSKAAAHEIQADHIIPTDKLSPDGMLARLLELLGAQWTNWRSNV